MHANVFASPTYTTTPPPHHFAEGRQSPEPLAPQARAARRRVSPPHQTFSSPIIATESVRSCAMRGTTPGSSPAPMMPQQSWQEQCARQRTARALRFSSSGSSSMSSFPRVTLLSRQVSRIPRRGIFPPPPDVARHSLASPPPQHARACTSSISPVARTKTQLHSAAAATRVHPAPLPPRSPLPAPRSPLTIDHRHQQQCR